MPSRDDDPRVSVSYRMKRSISLKIREFVRHHRGSPKFLELGSFIEQAALFHMERIQREIDDQSERRPSIPLGRQRILPGLNNRRRTTLPTHGVDS